MNGSCTPTEAVKPEDKTPEEQTPGPGTDVPGPEIALVAPADGFSIELWYNEDYAFEWKPLEGQNF